DEDSVVTQISVAGIEDHVTAKMLVDFFQKNIGFVWRCRLKTSSLPPDSYPNYDIDISRVQGNNDYERAKRHAYVHFAIPKCAKLAADAAASGRLTMGQKQLRVGLGPQNPHRMNERRRTISSYKLFDVSVEVGSMKSQNEFYVGWRGPSSGVDFIVDPYNGTCKIQFERDTAFSITDEDRLVVMKCNFKIEFTPREIIEIKRYRDFYSLIIMLQLFSSPLIYYRTADDDIEDAVPFDLLEDDDPWIRTTDFTSTGAIGRCNTYRISVRPLSGPQLLKALDYLRLRRVKVFDEFKGKHIRVMDEPGFGTLMSDPFFCIQNVKGLSFKITFLVNAVLHSGIINYHQMTEEFFDLLRTQPEELIVPALTHLSFSKRPVYDAVKALKAVQKWLLGNPKLLERPMRNEDTVEVRRLIITPTRAYCIPPEVELSNRVLRNYRDLSDRFLRVTFMDEAMQILNKNLLVFYPDRILREDNSNLIPQKTMMFKRIKDILMDGFYLCGMKYSFLAYSAGQLRDRSAWFFAEDSKIKVKNIKKWMGKFTDRNVAKCAARMGQCFSSTYATVEVPHGDVNFKLLEVKRNGYVFSDGIGTISPELASEVAKKLQLSADPPSAYQIRYGGYKGVIACWPVKDGESRLSLRRSMKKFESEHAVLEICSWTKFLPGFLNRQIITLLTALGVPDDIFWNMQETMIQKLNRMIGDAKIAFDVLTNSCAESGSTAAVMLSAGFRPQTEPHLRGMLSSIRAAQFGDLREKTRIFVSSGRWLMGCLDEAGVLEQGQCFIQASSFSLLNCFVKHGSSFSEISKSLKVIEGLVVVAKNPCLHPGDIRILEAVDAPELRHLHDCLVFPKKGERPHTDEASGSDLDGDVYFVTWDENLIPPSKQSWPPMEYQSVPVRELSRQVTHLDIVEFFSRNMVNDNLGTICNAHVVHSDLSQLGALDEKCLKLAELAALAVDFPKNGRAVNMPPELRPALYPDFMGKEEFQTYKSSKILGKLYRKIVDLYSSETECESAVDVPPLDPDPDLEVEGSSSFLRDAWCCKCSYDEQLLGLLGQYRVEKEEEVVSGHIYSMPKYSSKKQGEVKDRLRNAYHALRKEFRGVFENLGDVFDDGDEKNAVYERKASAWYRVTYHEEWVEKWKGWRLALAGVGDEGTAPAAAMLSFPWIAADYLARIKIRRRRTRGEISGEDVDSLARYLTDKI
ncbi:hypothetical protein M569_12646, partial [Genlisea aurea]